MEFKVKLYNLIEAINYCFFLFANSLLAGCTAGESWINNYYNNSTLDNSDLKNVQSGPFGDDYKSRGTAACLTLGLMISLWTVVTAWKNIF